MSPKISVLIPCFNRARYIKRVVDSILTQTQSADEIIVVDDASQDESVTILQGLPVRLICHEINQGPAAARNTALEAACGDVVIYIDSDAIANPRLIEILLATYQRPPMNFLAGVGGQGIETHQETVYDRWRTLHAKQNFGSRQRDFVPYLFGLCMSFKKEVLSKIGGFDPYFRTNAGEDLDIGYRIKRAGFWLRYTPEAIVYHLHSDDEESLKRTQYNWYYWSYLAKRRTHSHPWTLWAGTFRRLLFDSFTDMVIRRDLDLVKIDLQMSFIKIRALWAATMTGG